MSDFKEQFGRFWQGYQERVYERNKERMWQPRVILLPWLVAIVFQLWSRHSHGGLLDFPNVFSAINLGIHEIGHMVFRPFGRFLMIAGGSIFQCLVPIFAIVYCFRLKDDFTASVCIGWLSTNIFGVAIYMADAHYRELQLVSPFSKDPLHDWVFLFQQMGLMGSALTVATLTKIVATLVMAAALAHGSWVLYVMSQSERFRKQPRY